MRERDYFAVYLKGVDRGKCPSHVMRSSFVISYVYTGRCFRPRCDYKKLNLAATGQKDDDDAKGHHADGFIQPVVAVP